MNKKFTREQVSKMGRHELFDALLENLEDGTKITFTPDNIYDKEHTFINLKNERGKMVCEFDWRDLIWVYFDGVEPMLLEDCPTTFFRSILINLP